MRLNKLLFIQKILFGKSTLTINIKQLIIRVINTLVFFLKTSVLLGLDSNLALTILSQMVMILLKNSLWSIIIKLGCTWLTNILIDVQFLCFFCFFSNCTWNRFNLFFLCFSSLSFVDYCLFIWFYWRWFYCSI